jgi:pSer/pThr/pTyr-binding forkhead associated (FHA) protein
MGRLRLTNGPQAGHTLTVGSEVVIGSEDADLTIDDVEVSRRHAVVRRLRGALEVEDLGSATGTFVDGERIERPTRVGGGAEIAIGGAVLAVEGVLPLVASRSRRLAKQAPTRLSPIMADRSKTLPSMPPPEDAGTPHPPSDSPQAGPDG